MHLTTENERALISDQAKYRKKIEILYGIRWSRPWKNQVKHNFANLPRAELIECLLQMEKVCVRVALEHVLEIMLKEALRCISFDWQDANSFNSEINNLAVAGEILEDMALEYTTTTDNSHVAELVEIGANGAIKRPRDDFEPISGGAEIMSAENKLTRLCELCELEWPGRNWHRSWATWARIINDGASALRVITQLALY